MFNIFMNIPYIKPFKYYLYDVRFTKKTIQIVTDLYTSHNTALRNLKFINPKLFFAIFKFNIRSNSRYATVGRLNSVQVCFKYLLHNLHATKIIRFEKRVVSDRRALEFVIGWQ